MPAWSHGLWVAMPVGQWSVWHFWAWMQPIDIIASRATLTMSAPSAKATSAFSGMPSLPLPTKVTSSARMLRSVAKPRERFDLTRLRNIASAGEALGPETFAWAERELGLTIGEAYGQTECNLVLAACREAGVARPGSTGRPVPGHRVAILRPDGSEADIFVHMETVRRAGVGALEPGEQVRARVAAGRKGLLAVSLEVDG